jgi:hypothetical protein
MVTNSDFSLPSLEKKYLSSLGLIGEVVTTRAFDSKKDQGYNDI